MNDGVWLLAHPVSMEIISGLEERAAMLRTQIDTVSLRLAEFAAAIEEQGTTVTGSRQNVRPHPLIASERELTSGADARDG
jgi:hypothetical protein